MKTQALKGMRDLLPAEQTLRDYIQGKILETYRASGFERISTPMLEDMENLDKSDGGDNLNLIFKVLKRGDKLSLAHGSVFVLWLCLGFDRGRLLLFGLGLDCFLGWSACSCCLACAWVDDFLGLLGSCRTCLGLIVDRACILLLCRLRIQGYVLFEVLARRGLFLRFHNNLF